MQPDLSVIVPIYGPSTRLITLLEHLAEQTLAPERFEVIVVDDASPEPVLVEPAKFAFSLTLIRQDNTGPAGARNRALPECHAPLVLILNDDAVTARDLLEIYLRLQAEAPRKTAVLGTLPFTARALESPFVQALAESDLLFDFINLKSRRFYGWGYFWTCNLSLSLEALREGGGFDAENFREPVMEDVELGYRLEQLGWRVWYREEARCQHDHVLTPASYFRRMQEYGRNLTRMWRKHAAPTILGVATDALQEASLQHLQLQYEGLHPRFAAAQQQLERIEDEWRGRKLSNRMLADMHRLMHGFRAVPRTRGVAQELTSTLTRRMPTRRSPCSAASSNQHLPSATR